MESKEFSTQMGVEASHSSANAAARRQNEKRYDHQLGR
jgi:hypothetical protein